jgi:hypothetical protein
MYMFIAIKCELNVFDAYHVVISIFCAGGYSKGTNPGFQSNNSFEC